ncbi:HTTM domain-containing protein [Flavobacterium psychrotrophum]|uniref:HTTM domain-containing protein n=1 Tax=Flavobacterium psychrotrophum TaxID=2294119 RepID=UPI000E3207B2|nr:HTTM domain-containing protein [Flavobacterium psychrotrophum]
MRIKFLDQNIDNSQLILFRILFGFLLAWQAVLHIAEGWVYQNFIAPKFTFSHIGMEWLQPLPGNGMYVYFVVLALLGVLIMVGYQYRLSMILYTLLWAGIYFMQKTSYNNHYYLLILISGIMCVLPANAYASADSKLHPEIKRKTMPAWCRFVVVLQIGIVYFYASVAKLYPDWLNGTFTGGILKKAAKTYGIHFFREKWMHIFIAYAGIAFDLLIVPALLYKKTRPWALAAAIIFHLFNSFTLHIGIFPYLSLAMLVFFFPAEKITKWFFPKKNVTVTKAESTVVSRKWLWIFVPYFVFQVFMPLRHHIIKGDVMWTEEGHRLSWRMMLRKRRGYAQFKVFDKKTQKSWVYDLDDVLTPAQRRGIATKPDMLWQMAQYIHTEYAEKGVDVAVYITAKTSINKAIPHLLIDPKIDMAAAEWNYFSHNDWILLYK